jgi:primosomal protein N' (replication factor Y)
LFGWSNDIDNASSLSPSKLTYADIILPVPLDGLFTYSVPAAWSDQIGFGMRVLVPFGPSKYHIGIVVRLHDQKPTAYKV